MRAAVFIAALAGVAAFTSQVLWSAYQQYPYCYRQPILVQTPKSLIVLVEGRPNLPDGWCSGSSWPDAPMFPIIAKTSADGGQTWGPEINVTAAGNLDFLTPVYDAVTQTVILLIQLGDNGIIQVQSSDFGATWQAPTNVAISNQFASLIPGVGHGIQISPEYCIDPTCGGTAGRLLLSFVCTSAGPVTNDTACGNCLTCLVSSDDHGASWQLRAVSAQQGSREAALVQMNSADFRSSSAVVYAAERNLGNNTGHRWHSISRDSGNSFDGAYYASDPLPDGVTYNWTGVVSGFTRFDTNPAAPNAPWLVFVAPADETQRANFSVFTSSNNGASWSSGNTLWAGPAGYSDALQLNSSAIAVVVENGVEEFAQQITFMVLTSADLPTPPQ
jgi:sialidase-1